MNPSNPLTEFRQIWDLSQPEAAAFFAMSYGYIKLIEGERSPMPKWMAEWLEDPMMEEAEIRRRVAAARATAAQKNASVYRTGRSESSNPVRMWRRRHGWTQKQAGIVLGVATSSICAWEIGDRAIPDNILRRVEDDSERNHE